MIKIIKYFFEAIIIYLFFIIIKIVGISISRILFSSVFIKIGPVIRSNNIIKKILIYFLINFQKKIKMK